MLYFMLSIFISLYSNINFNSYFMNKDFILQDMLESEHGSIPCPSAVRNKKPKTSTSQLQFHVASIYQEIYETINSKNMDIKLPQQVPTAAQRVSLMKNLIEYLLEQNEQKNEQTGQNNNDQSTIFNCNQCSTYEASLQKLQNQIRQHIRVQQQLKLYHDSLQQKIEQAKKQKKQFEKKYQSQKRHFEELKAVSNTNTQRFTKLQQENERLKLQLKNYKLGRTEEKKMLKNVSTVGQNKQNVIHRNISIKKDDKLQRKSIEKRNQSTQRWRSSINNNKSTKVFPMAEKLIQQRNRQERKKVIQSKFDYRK